MSVKLSFLESGYTRHPEAMVISGGSIRPIRFPATVAVIEHPKEGVILFDTGYSVHFYEQTRNFPERLYALVTPAHVEPDETAAAKLLKKGIKSKDIRKVILSHFHADHVAGVADFPYSEYVFMSQGYKNLKKMSRFSAVKAGFLGGLLPRDFEDRAKPLQGTDFKTGVSPLLSLDRGHDLFGDRSVIAIELPGHAEGHMGLLVQAADGKTYFLVADAAWQRRSYTENLRPLFLANIIFKNVSEYDQTLAKLHQLHLSEKHIQIVPCHCSETLDSLPRFETDSRTE